MNTQHTICSPLLSVFGNLPAGLKETDLLIKDVEFKLCPSCEGQKYFKDDDGIDYSCDTCLGAGEVEKEHEDYVNDQIEKEEKQSGIYNQ
jgi:hypothetical protein